MMAKADSVSLADLRKGWTQAPEFQRECAILEGDFAMAQAIILVEQALQ